MTCSDIDCNVDSCKNDGDHIKNSASDSCVYKKYANFKQSIRRYIVLNLIPVRRIKLFIL